MTATTTAAETTEFPAEGAEEMTARAARSRMRRAEARLEDLDGQEDAASPPAADPSAAAVKRKLRLQQQRRAAEGGAGADGAPPITEAATLGMPEPAEVRGGAGGPTAAVPLRLMLRAPVIARADALYKRLRVAFPDSFVLVATTDPTGEGFDLATAAELTRAWAKRRLGDVGGEEAARAMLGEIDADGPEAGALVALLAALEYGEGDAAADLAYFGEMMRDYDPEAEAERRREHAELSEAGLKEGRPVPEFEEHPFEGVCAAVVELAVPWTEGLAPQNVPALLRAHLRPADLCTLLRRMLRACNGCDEQYGINGAAADVYRGFFGSPSGAT